MKHGYSNDIQENLELSYKHLDRLDEINNVVFELCKTLSEDTNLEWNMRYIGAISELSSEVLVGNGIRVRYPSVVTNTDGTQYIEEYYVND